MQPLCCIVYISAGNHPYSEEDLEKLLKEARNFNAQVGVSGILLHHEGVFFQYIEGECGGGLDIVYDKICQSRHHRNIVELLRSPIKERLFGDWLMGSSRISKDTLLSLQNAQWQQIVNSMNQTAEHRNPALAMLKSQWQLITDRDY